MNEQKAINLCLKHQDPAGFAYLVQRYRREAFFHAFALLGNQDDALDACQDSFARAFAVITGLKELPRFYPWFYCILRNRCYNQIARQQTSRRFREAEETDPTLGIDSVTPGQALESREERQLVQRALGALKPEHREVLVLKYFLEHSYEEIASRLGIPRGTVMSRLFNARVALRDEFLKLNQAEASLPKEKMT